MAAVSVDVTMAAVVSMVVALAVFVLPNSEALFSFGLVRRENTTINGEGRGMLAVWHFRFWKLNCGNSEFLFLFFLHELLFLRGHSGLDDVAMRLEEGACGGQ